VSRAAGKAAHVPSPRSAPCCHVPRHKRRSQGAIHVGLQGLPRRGGPRPPWGVRPRAAGLRARRPGGAAWWPGCRAVVNRPCAGALTWGLRPSLLYRWCWLTMGAVHSGSSRPRTPHRHLQQQGREAHHLGRGVRVERHRYPAYRHGGLRRSQRGRHGPSVDQRGEQPQVLCLRLSRRLQRAPRARDDQAG
jgi:hypothetical protein